MKSIHFIAVYLLWIISIVYAYRLPHLQHKKNHILSKNPKISVFTLNNQIISNGYEPTEDLLLQTEKKLLSIPDEVDYIIIGSGIGGLTCAALLRWYGYHVLVLESHYIPGGVAHTFERDGFKFDAGPSLWNGMSTKPYNPLGEVSIVLIYINLLLLLLKIIKS